MERRDENTPLTPRSLRRQSDREHRAHECSPTRRRQVSSSLHLANLNWDTQVILPAQSVQQQCSKHASTH